MAELLRQKQDFRRAAIGVWGWYRRKTPAAIGDELGHISKQGNALLLRFLLVEAAQVTVRNQPQWVNPSGSAKKA
jgi:hypothetical protein